MSLPICADGVCEGGFGVAAMADTATRLNADNAPANKRFAFMVNSVDYDRIATGAAGLDRDATTNAGRNPAPAL